MRKYLVLLITTATINCINAQTNERYEPHELFTETFHMPAGNEFRSAKGMPGPAYWQNQADYLIHASFNERDTSVSGDVTITYTNNSPDKLEYLWLQLDQNIFKPDSRSVATTKYPGDYFGTINKINGGYDITELTVTYDGKSYHTHSIITDTRMQIFLDKPLQGKGDNVQVKMNFRFIVPLDGAGRFGKTFTKNGVIYQVGQWYPRMCVYDDVEGWNTLPYLGLGEFYCDYGNYDYYITAPADMLVFGSGDLQNDADVLTPEVIKRLKQAGSSDKTITIVAPGEINKGTRKPEKGNLLTWHYTMKNTRDIAFVVSKALMWDAARINLPSGRKALAMSCYPIESVGDTAWSRSTEYLKASIELYSRNFYEYPWNVAVSSAGTTGGMEYPGMIFNEHKLSKAKLWFLITHEIGHNWYPMIVGNNERRYMWQDEGFNTYINFIANDSFHNGEYQTDPYYFEEGFFGSRNYLQFSKYKDPLMTVSDAMDEEQHYQFYGKTAYGLNLLRTVIIGPERFDYAFKKYTEAWAFKHPTPYDFFHSINNGVGEDLNWFWKEWFFTTWKFDQAISDVKYVEGDPKKGALITISNNEKMIMPVFLKIQEENGASKIVNLPAEVWQRDGTWVYKCPSTSRLSEITLDPGSVLPDIDRTNNKWQSN